MHAVLADTPLLLGAITEKVRISGRVVWWRCVNLIGVEEGFYATVFAHRPSRLGDGIRLAGRGMLGGGAKIPFAK